MSFPFLIFNNNIFYLELAVDSTEFIKLHDFDANEVIDPDAIIAQAAPHQTTPHVSAAAQTTSADMETEALLKSLGM